jgi:hypothetical protein
LVNREQWVGEVYSTSDKCQLQTDDVIHLGYRAECHLWLMIKHICEMLELQHKHASSIAV